MKPLTCEQVEEHLDLYALNECPEPSRSAVAAHVAHCEACSRSLREARRLLGLLDGEFQDRGRLRRLTERLDRERPRLRLRIPGRVASLAALLLVGVGLTWLAPFASDPVVAPFAPPEIGVRAVPSLPESFSARRVRATYSIRPGGPAVDVTEGGLRLTSGTLWLTVTDRARFTVETPAATMIASAGQYIVEVAPGGTRVTIREGEATLSHGADHQRGRRGDVLITRR